MSVARLRTLDISSPEQEKLVQSLVDDKIEDGGAIGNVYRLDVPDIQTPEEEAKWQKTIDDRTRKARPRRVTPKTPQAQDPAGKPENTRGAADPDVSQPAAAGTAPVNYDLQGGGEPYNGPMVDYTLSEEDFERNPDLKASGAKVGDVIQVPAIVLDESDGPNAPGNVDKDTPPAKAKFCDFCPSKGGFHKKDCPAKKVG